MDWEKCFDLISFEAVDKALEYFNFGLKFRSFVQILLRDSESIVLNNGHFSDPIKVWSGVKQGSNASPLLFIYLAEVLAIQIRQNKDIKGIVLGDTERKLAQFADDLSLFLKYDKITIMELVNVLLTLRGHQILKSIMTRYVSTGWVRLEIPMPS